MNDTCMRSYKIKIYPTKEQKERLLELMNLYRFCYNWGLSKEKESYESGNGFLENFELHEEFKKYRNSLNEDWIKRIPINTADRALNDVIQAFKFFFNKSSRYPVYKSKKKYNNMKFSVRGQRVKFYGNYVSIEGMGRKNHIYCGNHNIPTFENVKYYNCRISYDLDNFWMSIAIEFIRPINISIESNESIGIDVGVKKLAVLSNGKEYISPDTSKLEKRARKLRKRYQRDIYRRVNEAKHTKTKYEDIEITCNEEKRAKSFRKCIRKINNVHRTFVSQISSEIVEMYPKRIIMEHLNISGMVTKHYIASDIYKSRLRMLKNQIRYKAEDRGIKFVEADMFFPSSQLCSNCGYRQKIGLSRTYRCPICGMSMDRDLNAAINLSNYQYQ